MGSIDEIGSCRFYGYAGLPVANFVWPLFGQLATGERPDSDLVEYGKGSSDFRPHGYLYTFGSEDSSHARVSFGQVDTSISSLRSFRFIRGVDQAIALFSAFPWIVGYGTASQEKRVRSFHKQLKLKLGAQARQFDGRQGLGGVPPFLFVGHAYSDFLGSSAMSRLSSSQARELADGTWVLFGGDSSDDWPADRWGDREGEIIEILGPEKFFDPSTGRLPTTPDFPEFAPYPVRLYDPEANSYYQQSPDGSRVDVDSIVSWDLSTEAMPAPDDIVSQANEATAHMLGMNEDFQRDDPLYWVEEFLRLRPEVEQHSRLELIFGAWLGEYARRESEDLGWEQLDGQWVLAAGASTFDPFAEVHALLASGSGSLREFVANSGRRGQQLRDRPDPP